MRAHDIGAARVTMTMTSIRARAVSRHARRAQRVHAVRCATAANRVVRVFRFVRDGGVCVARVSRPVAGLDDPVADASSRHWRKR